MRTGFSKSSLMKKNAEELATVSRSVPETVMRWTGSSIKLPFQELSSVCSAAPVLFNVRLMHSALKAQKVK